jgi:hypothetical protein
VGLRGFSTELSELHSDRICSAFFHPQLTPPGSPCLRTCVTSRCPVSPTWKKVSHGLSCARTMRTGYDVLSVVLVLSRFYIQSTTTPLSSASVRWQRTQTSPMCVYSSPGKSCPSRFFSFRVYLLGTVIISFSTPECAISLVLKNAVDTKRCVFFHLQQSLTAEPSLHKEKNGRICMWCIPGKHQSQRIFAG